MRIELTKKDVNDIVFVTKWKKRMRDIIKSTYGEDTPDDKIEAYLSKKARETFKDRPAAIVNNYTNKLATCTLSEIFDMVENKQYIIGGDGVLFLQHDEKDNPTRAFITYNKSQRSAIKKERKKYDKGDYIWLTLDISQNNVKLIINSLYGVLGYVKFILSNRFIAQSVTNQGRQIICTAVCCFENFLADNLKFLTSSEMFEYIQNILNEYRTIPKEKQFHLDMFDMPTDYEEKVRKRLLKKCGFVPTKEDLAILDQIIANCTKEELSLLYYKNNLMEFNELPFIRAKLNYLVEHIEELKSPDKIKDLPKDLQDMIEDIIAFYMVFVAYTHPVFDRVRRGMFTNKKAVLYVDTDSNFLGLAPIMTHTRMLLKEEVIEKKDPTELRFILVNLIATFCQRIVNEALHRLAVGMNVKGEWAHIFTMKNEFYYDRIIFTDKKKRYVANQILKEGSIINNGIGEADIKGFDFKKATTKEFLREYYTYLCEEYILRADKINVSELYRILLRFRDQMKEEILNGDTKFYKQASVKAIENYKTPWSTQGVVAVHVWNTFNPDYMMELPVDCNIVPIKEFTAVKKSVVNRIGDKKETSSVYNFYDNKNVIWLQNNHPKYFDLFRENIIESPNQDIRKMSIKYMAVPKNEDIPLPDFFKDVVNVEKILIDAQALFSPLMESLGLRTQKVNSTTSYLSNIVKL